VVCIRGLYFAHPLFNFVFMNPTTKSHFFFHTGLQYELSGFGKREGACLQRGADWTLDYNSVELATAGWKSVGIQKVLRRSNNDQGFPWFSSVLQQMLSWYRNSTLHCMFLMQPSATLISNFFAKPKPSKSDQNFLARRNTALRTPTQSKCSTSFPCCILPA
jgi:hypothetical protein